MQHDLRNAYDHCVSSKDEAMRRPVLVLRKWFDFSPSMEFRCFVDDNELVAACQRYCGVHYPFLSSKREELASIIDSFFEKYVRRVFSLDRYTIDVYVDKKGRAWIVDFAPLARGPQSADAPPPHALLSWKQLESLCGVDSSAADRDDDDDDVFRELRIVESTEEVDSQRTKVLGMHRVPIEIATGELNSSNIADYLEKLQKLQVDQDAAFSSDDETS